MSDEQEKQEAKRRQIALAEKLQLKWLERMDAMLEEGTITSTDMATLARLLMANGWSLDPHQLPQRLKDKLQRTDPRKFDDGDADIIGRIA